MEEKTVHIYTCPAQKAISMPKKNPSFIKELTIGVTSEPYLKVSMP